MPERKTKRRAKKAKRQGKAATTQAGEYVREEMHHKKRGKHPVKSRKQAIAIGLSKARREGINVPRKRSSRSSRSHGGRQRTKSSR
ncbi:MAG TPA: DUF6496 domain-containing protein [Nitrospiraceae bacterium]|nr:DUF6496 domain-containing protein [Nitrospiraceae bacterium]